MTAFKLSHMNSSSVPVRHLNRNMHLYGHNKPHLRNTILSGLNFLAEKGEKVVESCRQVCYWHSPSVLLFLKERLLEFEVEFDFICENDVRREM